MRVWKSRYDRFLNETLADADSGTWLMMFCIIIWPFWIYVGVILYAWLV